LRYWWSRPNGKPTSKCFHDFGAIKGATHINGSGYQLRKIYGLAQQYMNCIEERLGVDHWLCFPDQEALLEDHNRQHFPHLLLYAALQSGVISPYQVISPHAQGLPVCSAPSQVEQVEEEKQDEREENRHGEDEGLV
jgi:hypothetical protein